jgi:predicted ATPase
VLLAGEPGIGKSRILSALRERVEAHGAQTLRFQCSPYYVNSAFYPLIDNFERALRFGRDETPEAKLDKLEALLAQSSRPVGDVRFLASMLSVPCDQRYGPLPMTPHKQKEETLRALADLVEAQARRRPSVMLFEDLHWVDPSTLDALDLLIGRGYGFPLMMVLTHRPEFQSRWLQHGHVTALNLSKLARTQSSALVSRIARDKPLPAGLLERIIAKTDGVPLYLEELTRAILESGQVRDTGDRYVYSGAAAEISIPATLRDSLMARLDRVMPVKEVAQIGASIGREFSYELISAVAPMAQAQLDDALARLTESGLALRRGTPPDATYTFKHALVQDAAYDSLLKSRRQELHGKIARVIEECFPHIRETEPEMLAHHYTEMGLPDKAIPYWLQAGATRACTPGPAGSDFAPESRVDARWGARAHAAARRVGARSADRPRLRTPGFGRLGRTADRHDGAPRVGIVGGPATPGSMAGSVLSTRGPSGLYAAFRRRPHTGERGSTAGTTARPRQPRSGGARVPAVDRWPARQFRDCAPGGGCLR